MKNIYVTYITGLLCAQVTIKLTEISSSYRIYAWVKNSYATGSKSQSFAAFSMKGRKEKKKYLTIKLNSNFTCQ